MSSKELEQLQKRRQKAQDQGDIAEEAKLCNAIGELYSQNGNYKKGLKYHHLEISLSEAAGDQIGAAVAHRKVGECYCELGSYQDAIHHQKQHLRIARGLGDLAEEQRALATLGRTYFVYSQSEEERGKLNATDLLIKAEKNYIDSLDVCDKLVSLVSDKEVLEMRSRLYLNLGLIYEAEMDVQSARGSMEKALNILRELGDSATLVQCSYDLGSLHLRDRRPRVAIACFQETLDMAREQKNNKLEVDALREMAQAYLRLDNLQVAKSCLKKALLLNQPQAEKEQSDKQLCTIRKVLQYSSEVENLTEPDEMERKLWLYEKLGDLCCFLKAYSAAVGFYGQQLDLAESHDRQPSRLSPIYISLARTHIDCAQFPQAEMYYKKELEYCCLTPLDKCYTWTSIAKMHVRAGHSSTTVMEAYHKAAGFAEKSGNLKHQMDVYKSILKYCRSHDDDLDSELSEWESKLAHLLEDHPELAEEGSGSSDVEDSQGLDYQDLSDVPSSLPSEDPDDEEEEGYSSQSSIPMATTSAGVASSSSLARQPPITRSATGVVVKKKPKLLKRNEKGETLLHVAAIQGNLATVKKLIREGADVNARDFCGWIPLHEACNHGHTDVVSVLLDGNANIDDPGGPHCNGITPLIDAANNGHVDVVRLLIEKGANVMLKDQRGYTALDTVVERLASKAESGQSYDLEEEHKAIRELLRREMRKLGYEPPPRSRGSTDERTATGERKSANGHQPKQQKQIQKQHSSSISRPRKRSSHTSVSSTHTKKSTLPRDRFSSNLLYSSSDEEDNITNTISMPKSRSSSLQATYHRNSRPNTDGTNPFENFTVGKSSDTSTGRLHQSIRSSEIAGQRSKNRLPVSSTVAISGHNSRFNPLGQVEGCVSALIPENEEEELRYGGRSLSRDNEGGLPLDDWLVDDMAVSSRKDQSAAKRKKHQRSSATSRKEIKSFLEGTTSSSAAVPSRGGGRKRPLQRKNQTTTSLERRSRSSSISETNDCQQCTDDEQQSSNKKRKTTIVVEDSSSDSDERFLNSVNITENDMMDSDSTTSTLVSTKSSHQTRASSTMDFSTTSSSGALGTSTPHSRFSSSLRKSSERQSSSFSHQSASSSRRLASSNTRIDSTAATFNQFQPSLAATNSAPNITYCPDVPPLRVRVKIESRSYLVPCPSKDSSGRDTTIQWLMSQASERHYAQQGVRPRLSLTTSDGAILCPTDLVSHVLSPNEEVVGVVEGWVEEMLEESYLTACKKEGVEPYSRALQFFKIHTSSSSSLDFSDLQLTADNSRPIFKALGSGSSHQHTLTRLILKGNQLGDTAMVDLNSALSRVSTLSELNLSRTGITAQGVELLARCSPTQHSTAAELPSVVTDSSPISPWLGLRTLNLSFNKLGVACGRGLAALLGHCKGLQELSLISCRLGPGTFDKDTGLCEALKALLDLIELNVSLNPLGPEGVAALFPALPPQLSRLNLRETCKKNRPITEAMTKTTATTLNTSELGDECWLEYLDLSHCGLNDRGLPTLIGWLEGCGDLKELKLSGSSITASGVDPLCRYISTSSALRSLDMSGAVRLGNAGAVKVLQACRTCGLFDNNEEGNDRGRGRVCLKGCGLESPLPGELIELLRSVMKDPQDNAVDLSGNKIDNFDRQKIFVDT